MQENMQIVKDQLMKEKALLGNVTFIQIGMVILMGKLIVVSEQQGNATDIQADLLNLRA